MQLQHDHNRGHLQKATGFYTSAEDCTKDRNMLQVAPRHVCSDEGVPPPPTDLQEISRQVRHSDFSLQQLHVITIHGQP